MVDKNGVEEIIMPRVTELYRQGIYLIAKLSPSSNSTGLRWLLILIYPTPPPIPSHHFFDTSDSNICSGVLLSFVRNHFPLEGSRTLQI